MCCSRSWLSGAILLGDECLLKIHHQPGAWAAGKAQAPDSCLHSGVDGNHRFPEKEHQLVLSLIWAEQQYCENTSRGSVPRLLWIHQKSELYLKEIFWPLQRGHGRDFMKSVFLHNVGNGAASILHFMVVGKMWGVLCMNDRAPFLSFGIASAFMIKI